MGGETQRAAGEDLVAYVPAIHAEWLESGDPAPWKEVAGSLVFADVSGFTPLTERLAKLGKVGAEELTDILNQVFTGLLDVAEAHGGDLLKFGGDALLLLFTGDQHALRAAAGAAGMQAALRPYRRFQTNGGSVSLRMSVGVNTGTFQLFNVGRSHRELLVAGPASSATAELEGAADAGEVLLGPATAAALPPRHHGAPKDGGILLRGSPTVDLEPLRRPQAGPATEQAIPVQLRDHLRSRHDDGEHRVAVLTFIQFKGTDDLLAAAGPAAVAAELDALVTATQEACQTYGVTFLASDVDQNGGKLLLAGGAPIATPDDADRMLHTLRSIVLPERTLKVRAGVNRGRAFAVDIGSPTRRTYAVMGDPTNLAARVMGKAANRSVLATDAVISALRDRFQLAPVEPFMVKGKSAPISANVVGEAVGRAAAGRELPLAGRHAELTRLQELYERTRAGSVCTVVLEGEPGIGKSRLVEEFLAAAPTPAIVRVEAAQYAASSPYFAVRGPLRRLIGAPPLADEPEVAAHLDRAVTEQTPQLRPLLPLIAVPFGLDLPDTPESAAIAPAFRRSRMQVAVVELARALLPPSGVLVVEDAQWMDPASSELINDLLGDWPGAGWLVCTTRRPGEAGYFGTEDAERLELGPLATAARRTLLEAATAARPLPDHVLAAIAERSGGNPLFLGELITAVLASGSSSDLPDNVEALIAGRIDDLLPELRAVLRKAAVLGSRFTGELLAKLVEADGQLDVDPSAVVGQLDEFLEQDGGGRLRFRQTLVREVAYENLPYRQRRRLHDEAGRLIEHVVSDVEEFSDLLSLHFLRAQRYEKAWRYGRVAAARARRSAAPVEATEFYRRALEAARHLELTAPEVAEVHHDLGTAAELAGSYDTAAEAFQSARRLTPRDSPKMIALYRKSGHLRERTSHYAQALSWYAKGLRAADALPDLERARARAALLTSYGATRMRQGRFREAIRLLEEAVRFASVNDDREVLAHAYYLLDWAHSDLGDPEAHRYRVLALPIYEELGDWAGQANVLNNLGVDAYFEGRWADAIDLYDRSRIARGKAGDLVQLVTATNNIGEILSDQGHLDRARACFEEALRTWRAAHYPVGIGLAISNLGRVASRSAHFEEAASLLEEAVRRFRDARIDAFALEAHAREVERLVLLGDHERARHELDLLRSDRKVTEQPVLQAMLERLGGYADAQGGEMTASRTRLEASLRIGQAASAEFEVALTEEALGRVGAIAGWSDDVEHKDEAIRRLAALDVVRTPEVPLPGRVGGLVVAT